MSEQDPYIGYVMLAATRDRIPVLAGNVVPVSLVDGQSPVWQNPDGVQYLIANGGVTQTHLDYITQVAEDEGWITPTGAPLPTSDFVGWKFLPFEPEPDPLGTMYSWGIVPVPEEL